MASNMSSGSLLSTSMNKMHITMTIRKSQISGLYFELQGDTIATRNLDNRRRMPEAFNKLFNEMKESMRLYIKLVRDKRNVQVDILQAFEKVIPFGFYGCIQHKKQMHKIISLIITRARHECIFKSHLVNRWNVEKVPWLKGNDVSPNLRNKILMNGIRKVLNEIVLQLFSSLYIAVYAGSIYEIKFALRVEWQAYLQKVLHILEKKGHLLPMDVESAKNVQSRGKLAIKPKGDLTRKVKDVNQFRPFVRLYKKDSERRSVKLININIYNYARTIDVAKAIEFYNHWKQYVSITKGRKIYGVVIDLQDCFSNVNLGILIKLIKNCSDSMLSVRQKKFLLHRIQNQYVHFKRYKTANGNKIYKTWKWNHGLLQGDKFSSALCELYVSHLNKVHLQDLNKYGCFLHRTVDDFLFCSTDQEDVDKFLQITKDNYGMLCKDKIQFNTDQTRKTNPSVIYCGKEIDLNTKEIRYYYKFKKGTNLHYRFKTWNRNITVNRIGILYKSVYFPYNNHFFGSEFYNIDYNSRKTILENFYNGMLFMSHKLEYTLMASTLRKIHTKDVDLIEKLVSDMICYYATKCLIRLKDGPVRYNDLHKVGILASINVFSKRSCPAYKIIVQNLKNVSKLNYVKDLNIKEFKKRSKMFDNINVGRKFRPMTAI